MGILGNELNKSYKHLKVIPVGSVSQALSVPTGFPLIDYECATLCENKDGEEFVNLGLPWGKIFLFCGNSQGGKTTLSQQIADNMARPYEGDVVVLDYERSSNNLAMRYMSITGTSKKEFTETVQLFNHTDMSTEFFKEIIFKIIELKKSLGKKAMMPWYDTEGEEILVYRPTIIIADSIPSIKPKEVLEDASLDNNMIPGKMAAANSALLKTIVNSLETYNITIFGINHITTKIITNKYAPRKVQLPGLGDDENLPGETLSPLVQ